MHRFNFKNEVRRYGMPIANSTNGQNFIFKRSLKQMKHWNLNLNVKGKGFVQEYLTINVMNVSVFGVRHVKEIDIFKEYQQE